jgi:S-DNA-T family DNA segregation ATPase FtsK/SpoIIIE
VKPPFEADSALSGFGSRARARANAGAPGSPLSADGYIKFVSDQNADAAFHRPPREWPEPVPSDELRMHAPPARPEPPSGGWIQALFPVIGSFTMVCFAVVYHNRMFMYIAVGLVFISLLFAGAMRWSQYRQVRQKRERNRVKYRQHLAQTEHELAHVAARQLDAGDRLYPDHERLWGLVMQRRHLWERRAGDPDFIQLRLGRGPVPLARPIRLDFSDDPLTEREADLEDEAATVRARWERVNDAPVTVDLARAQVVSLVGPPERGRALARSLVSQLAAFRAPSDLRVLAAFDRDATAEWEWMKWLPHARAEVRSRQDAPGALPPPVLLADSGEALGRMLEGELGPRLEQLRRLDEQSLGGGGSRVSAPRLVVFVDNYSPDGAAARLPALREAMVRGARLEVTVVVLAPTPAHEPSEADVRVVLSPAGTASVEERGEGGGRHDEVWADAADRGLSEALARSMAPLRLAARDAGRAEADEVRQLELLGASSVADLDIERLWTQRPRSQELRVPIGLNAEGEPVTLDLKQAAEGGMGPHGLLVGATGSGKSELLRTLVSSLALTHSPDALSFVLIDYKGGAAFAELSKLPHTAGLITNLQQDASLVDRMRDALLGEQERRQRMLREAGDLDDIRAYRTARDSRPELPAMPHLVVVVDEFGELLAARPEFIDLFLGIGRVGRSLGMHLLFSSQKLEEGRLRGLDSNLRYRLCLRTYSAPDSKVVLGTPDAYLLPPYPGAAYLKVDTALYERFKVSLVSGREREQSPAAAIATVSTFALGGPGDGDSGDGDGSGSGAPTDLDELVELMASAHRGEVHQVWAPPLEPLIKLAAVEQPAPWWEGDAERDTGVTATLGVVDVPAEQRREPLVLDFAGSAGHLALVGAPQSGKTTLLRTLIGSLAASHRPDRARVYAIDLGGGLADVEAAPSVGGVSTKSEREKVRQTVRYVQALVDERELLFRRLGLGSMRDARALRASGEAGDADLADVFLVVDGWGALRREFEDLDLDIEHVAAAGLSYGVHVVVAANRWAEMRPNLRDNLGARIELRLNDPIESELGRRVAETVPADVPGRGLTPAGLHFQAAVPSPALLEGAAAHWSGASAAPVPVLPRRLEAASLRPPEGPALAIGVDEKGLEPALLDLSGGDPHFMVLGDSESGKTNLLRLIARGIVERQDPGRAQLAIVDYRRGLLDLSELPHVHSYAASAAMASDTVAALRTELSARLPGPSATREELLGGPSWTGPRIYLIVDDYDLVPGALDNPLAPLVDLLAHGRDVGLHVLLARRVAGTARSAFEPFFQRLGELRPPGLLMSGDADEGPLLGGRRATPLPPGRGLYVRRDGGASLIQTALAPESPAGAVETLHRSIGGSL